MGQILVACTECGHPMLMTNRKRRACHVCQAARDVQKLTRGGTRSRGKSCATCKGRFFPFRSNYDQCPKCVEAQRPDRFPQCRHCHMYYRPAPGLDGTDRGCVVCITSTAENQRRYWRTVHKIRDERIATPCDYEYEIPWPPPDDFKGTANEWAYFALHGARPEGEDDF